MSILAELTKGIRYKLENHVIDSQFAVGKSEAMKSFLLLLEASQMTKKCPQCGETISIVFSEKHKELMMVCERYKCGYNHPLDQIGFF